MIYFRKDFATKEEWQKKVKEIYKKNELIQEEHEREMNGIFEEIEENKENDKDVKE